MIAVDADIIIARNPHFDGLHHHSREPQHTLKCSCAFTWCSLCLATSSWRAAWSALRPSSSASLQDHGELCLLPDLRIWAMQPVKKDISHVLGNVRQCSTFHFSPSAVLQPRQSDCSEPSWCHHAAGAQPPEQLSPCGASLQDKDRAQLCRGHSGLVPAVLGSGVTVGGGLQPPFPN